MLLHSPFQRDIVIFGPSTQGVQEKHRVFVAPLQELAPRILHEQGMPIVHGVAQLKRKDSI